MFTECFLNADRPFPNVHWLWWWWWKVISPFGVVGYGLPLREARRERHTTALNIRWMFPDCSLNVPWILFHCRGSVWWLRALARLLRLSRKRLKQRQPSDETRMNDHQRRQVVDNWTSWSPDRPWDRTHVEAWIIYCRCRCVVVK
jgi:hypothetical protein